MTQSCWYFAQNSRVSNPGDGPWKKLVEIVFRWNPLLVCLCSYVRRICCQIRFINLIDCRLFSSSWWEKEKKCNKQNDIYLIYKNPSEYMSRTWGIKLKSLLPKPAQPIISIGWKGISFKGLIWSNSFQLSNSI